MSDSYWIIKKSRVAGRVPGIDQFETDNTMVVNQVDGILYILKIVGGVKTVIAVQASSNTFSQNLTDELNAADAKTTPVDADHLPLLDSEDGNKLKRLSWLNLKNTLKSLFVTYTNAVTNIDLGLFGITSKYGIFTGKVLKQTGTGGSVFLGDLAGNSEDLTNRKNIFIGLEAGRYVSTGTDPLLTNNNCIYIGPGTRSKADDTTNEIVIGFEALGNGDNTAVIGNKDLIDLYAGEEGGANVQARSLVLLGSWRIEVSGANLEIQKLVGGNWITKQIITE